MLQNFQDILERNWKSIATTISGFVLGAFVFGNIINGVSLVFNEDGWGIVTNRTEKLKNEVDVTGEWVYVAETNSDDITFSEDKCRKRFGTVYINQKADSYELTLTGERKVKEECAPNQQRITQVIHWSSENAAVSKNDQKMSLWFKTQDDVSRYGYISANIIKSVHEVKPTKMQGDMYYLDDSNNTWFKAKINFYRAGSQEAKAIERKWP